MAYIREVEDLYGRTIFAIDNANDYINAHSTQIATEDVGADGVTASKLIIGGGAQANVLLSDVPLGVDGQVERVLVFNGRRIEFVAGNPTLLAEENGVHIHIFNSLIYMNYGSDDPTRTLSTQNNVVTGTIGSDTTMNLHNCDIVFNVTANSGMRVAHFNDCRFHYLDPDPGRLALNLLDGGRVEGLTFNGGNLTYGAMGALGGFRITQLQTQGFIDGFSEFTSASVGISFGAADSYAVAPEFLIAEPVVHDQNDDPDRTNGPTMFRNSGAGLIFPSPRIPVANRDIFYATSTAHKAASRQVVSAHWTPRYFADALLTSHANSVYANITTDANYPSPGPGTGNDDGVRGLVATTDSIEYTYISNSDGYLEGGTDISGLTADNSDNDTEFRDIYVPVVAVEFTDTTQNTSVSDFTEFNQSTAIGTEAYNTTIEVLSLLGDFQQRRTYSDSLYAGGDSDYEIGDLAVPTYYETTTVVSPDEGMEVFTRSDNASVVTVITDHFDSHNSYVGPNELAALYKLAVCERDIEYFDYTIVGSGDWDISENTVDSIQFGHEATSTPPQYVVGGDMNRFFNVRAAGVVSNGEIEVNNGFETVTKITAVSIALRQNTWEDIDVETRRFVDGDPQGLLDPQTTAVGATVGDDDYAFRNCDIQGQIYLGSDFEDHLRGSDHELHFDNCTFGDNVTLRKHADVGEITVFGALAGDFAEFDEGFIFPFTERFVVDASALDYDVYYRIVIDNTLNNDETRTFGVITAGGQGDITLASNIVAGLGISTTVHWTFVGADAISVVGEAAESEVGTPTRPTRTITLTQDPNYNAVATVDADVGSSFRESDNMFVFEVPVNKTLGGSVVNATFGLQKSTQDFADFISTIERSSANLNVDFPYISRNTIELDPDYYVIQLQADGDNVTQSNFGGIRTPDGLDSSRDSLIEDAEVTPSGSTVDVGAGFLADDAIDYAAFGTEVQLIIDPAVDDLGNQITDARNFITDNDDDNFAVLSDDGN